MNVHKAAIFDLDGTLLNTLPDIANAMNRVLQRYNAPQHSSGSYRHFIGKGIRNCVQKALPEHLQSGEIIEDCIQQFNIEYERHWNTKTSPYPEIPSILDHLTQKGVRMAILSNKPHIFIHRCVETFLQPSQFEFIFGQRQGIPPKPSPIVAENICKKMKLSPEHFIFVGDTVVDIQTAQNAGMTSIAVTWGYRTSKELQQAQPDHLIKSPGELLNFF